MGIIPKIVMSRYINRIGIPHIILDISIPHEYADVSC